MWQLVVRALTVNLIRKILNLLRNATLLPRLFRAYLWPYLLINFIPVSQSFHKTWDQATEATVKQRCSIKPPRPSMTDALCRPKYRETNLIHTE